jgi:hypothetical protein
MIHGNLIPMNHFHRFCCCLLLLGIAACKQQPGASQVVVWPELSAFDETAAKAEGLARVGDLDALRQMLPELVETGLAVTPATIPANAKNPAALAAPLADLSELVTKLAAPALTRDDLNTLTLALHPLVEWMMGEAGMPHIHANEGPHGGFFHPLFEVDGKQAATVEIKLHDDAGDIEVWLVKGGRDGAPLDLPLDSVLILDFPALKRGVELRVRDTATNADEDGKANIRGALTNYFIFPGEIAADAAWLTGADFAAQARLTVPGGLSTEVFVLRPHVHHE